MPTTFKVVGPVEVRREGGKGGIITRQEGTDFWARAPEAKTVAGQQGCYVFATRAGRGYTPWYVGKTTNSMRGECFQPDKTQKYNEALQKAGHGRPMLFFVVRCSGARGRVPSAAIGDMEKQLIHDGLQKNDRLLNTHNRNNLPCWAIKGVVRSGKGAPSRPAVKFRTMMGLQ